MIDEILRREGIGFRAHVMPVAVGIYLPLGLSVPILVGGIINYLVSRRASLLGDQIGAIHRGTLFSSGLIAGEAIMGIIIAFLIFGGLKFPKTIFESNILSIVLVALVVIGLVYVSLKGEQRR